MEIYDIIHGTINIDESACKIIDTFEFQRLRNIKQLGCCNYVFPSATHTRFEHSLGVYHLACKYIDILNKKDDSFDENTIKLVTTAALIHDLGHGPYSHLFDEIVDSDNKHEDRSLEIFKLMNTKYHLNYSEDDMNQIEIMLNPSKFKDQISEEKKYMYQIVSNSNGIDVDRFDYIMRDIKMTGLNYGIEYERIMLNSEIVDGEIIYSEKVKTNIEDFFRIRFIMYKNVYNHHTVRGIEFMMKDYIKIYINEVVGELSFDDDYSEFLQLNDSIIDIVSHWDIWNPKNYDENDKDIKQMKKIINNIRKREIYKCVGDIIADSKIEFDNYDEDNIIIDTIKLSFYGKEKCKYIKHRSIDKTINIKNNDKYITSIYYKSHKYKEKAEEIFKALI